MELSVAVGALTLYPLDLSFAIARDAGAEFVEVLLSRRMRAGDGRAIVERANRAGVTVMTAHAALALRPEPLEEKIAADIASIRVAAGIDSCRSLVLHTPLSQGGEAAPVQRWLDAVAEARERIHPRLDLALENRAENSDGLPGQWLDDTGRLAPVASEWGMRVCLDLAHAASFGLDLPAVVKSVGPQLANVHLSDARDRQYRGGLLNGLLRDHAIPGHGILAIDEALNVLNDIGYRGPLTLELSPLSLRAWLPGAPRRQLRAAVADVRARLALLAPQSDIRLIRPHRTV